MCFALREQLATYFFFLSWNANTNTLQQEKKKTKQKSLIIIKNGGRRRSVKNRRWKWKQYEQDRICSLSMDAGSALPEKKGSEKQLRRLCKIRNTSYERKLKKKTQNYLYRKKKSYEKKKNHNATH